MGPQLPATAIAPASVLGLEVDGHFFQDEKSKSMFLIWGLYNTANGQSNKTNLNCLIILDWVAYLHHLSYHP